MIKNLNKIVRPWICFCEHVLPLPLKKILCFPPFIYCSNELYSFEDKDVFTYSFQVSNKGDLRHAKNIQKQPGRGGGGVVTGVFAFFAKVPRRVRRFYIQDSQEYSRYVFTWMCRRPDPRVFHLYIIGLQSFGPRRFEFRTHVYMIMSKVSYQRASYPAEIVWVLAGFSTVVNKKFHILRSMDGFENKKNLFFT